MTKYIVALTTKAMAYACAAALLLAPVSAQAAESARTTAVAAPAAAAQTAQAAGTTMPVESGDASAVITAAILALQTVYPEGTPWTDANQMYYNAKAWSFYGTGCSALAMQISDAIYGVSTPVHLLYGLTPDDLRAGDYVRIDGVHSAIVVSTDATSITLCEGNWNAAVHWGRTLTKASLQGHISYVARRG